MLTTHATGSGDFFKPPKTVIYSW